MRILIDSELYTNSKNFLREIKAHLRSSKMVEYFGEFQGDLVWQEGECSIKQRTKHFKEASITCGGVETEKTGQHFDLIIFDDMNSNNNSKTEEGRLKVIDHYKLSSSILEPNGTMVVIGTRYADNDLIGWILKQEIYYDSRR